jgi:hypothetical protein
VSLVCIARAIASGVRSGLGPCMLVTSLRASIIGIIAQASEGTASIQGDRPFCLAEGRCMEGELRLDLLVPVVPVVAAGVLAVLVGDPPFGQGAR